MQRSSSGLKSLLFAIIGTRNQSHEFAHTISVKVGRTEGVFGYEPSRREDDKVCYSNPGVCRLARQDGENRRIGMVLEYCVIGYESVQIVLELCSVIATFVNKGSRDAKFQYLKSAAHRKIVSVPCNHVKR